MGGEGGETVNRSHAPESASALPRIVVAVVAALAGGRAKSQKR
ncbi:hypothetical protein [Rugosimonospora acidiphila]